MPFSYAISFNLEIENIKTNIYADEFAKYNITLTNFEKTTETYSLSTPHNWMYIINSPLTNIGFNESKTTTLFIKPRSLLPTGKSYSVSLELESSTTGYKRIFNVPVYLKSYDTNYDEYVPALTLSAEYGDAKGNINPNDDFKLKLKLKNRNGLNISNMIMRINGDLFYENVVETLLPQAEKTIQLTFDLDPIQEPGVHNLKVDLIIDDKIYASLDETYNIIEYSKIDVDSVKERQFLRTINKIYAVNHGNVESTKIIEINKNWLERLFISSETPYELAYSDDKPVLKWTVKLGPEESTEIYYSSNYRLLFIIALVILLSIYLYFTYRSEIVIHKKAKVLHTKDIDGASKIKIKLFLRNRTGKILHEVEIKEKLSKLTKIVEDNHTLGSPKPSKIIRGKRNTFAKWEFDKLEPHEERIITYKLESQLKLIGSVEFPRSVVKFKNIDGKVRRTRSNICMLALIKKSKKNN